MNERTAGTPPTPGAPTAPPAEERVVTGELTFGVDAGLLFQLGEQLVARRSVALSELIKNAYDADATRVDVLLENVTREGGTIIVQDDGLGMTFEQVRDSWMQVATDEKVREPYSPSGRARTGAKGVGRFAARRLGNRLALVTVADRKDGSREEVRVDFNWAERFKPGQPLGNVPVVYTRRPVGPGVPTGTFIAIEDARDVWTEDDVADLRRDLVTLVNPFSGAEFEALRPDVSAHAPAPGSPRSQRARKAFRAVLQAPEFPELEGDLSDYFLRAAWGSLAGVVLQDGTAQYRLQVRTTGEDVVYTAPAGSFDLIPHARLIAFSFVYKGELFGDFDFTANDARRIGRETGGIRIYLDDFRVFPYGDPKDDWLRLNEMRASRTPQLLRRGAGMKEAAGLPPSERPELLVFGTNQLFGAVEISRFEQPAIEVNVSRERLVENAAFTQLREFVQLGIFWMTVQYARVSLPEREARRVARQQGAVAKAEDAEALLRRVQELVDAGPQAVLDQLPQIQAGVADLSAQLHDLRLTAEAEERDRISERAMLRVLASTGTSVNVVNHQLEGLAEAADGIATDLGELAASPQPVAPPRLESVRGRAEEWRTLVQRQIDLLGLLLGREARTRRRRHPLRPLVEALAGAFSAYCGRFGMVFHNEVPPDLRTPSVYEAEIAAVLLNAITNALKALQRVDASRRHFGIRAAREGDRLLIHVLDTGPGVPEADRERVFKPFESTSEPDPILGAGTGLGLMVVLDLLAEYDGAAEFVDPDPTWPPPAPQLTWRTALQISLPSPP